MTFGNGFVIGEDLTETGPDMFPCCCWCCCGWIENVCGVVDKSDVERGKEAVEVLLDLAFPSELFGI